MKTAPRQDSFADLWAYAQLYGNDGFWLRYMRSRSPEKRFPI